MPKQCLSSKRTYPEQIEECRLTLRQIAATHSQEASCNFSVWPSGYGSQRLPHRYHPASQYGKPMLRLHHPQYQSGIAHLYIRLQRIHTALFWNIWSITHGYVCHEEKSPLGNWEAHRAAPHGTAQADGRCARITQEGIEQWDTFQLWLQVLGAIGKGKISFSVQQQRHYVQHRIAFHYADSGFRDRRPWFQHESFSTSQRL